MIEVIIGPMFSGKTSLLLSKITEVQEMGNSYVVIKPDVPSRSNDDNSTINSHNKLRSVKAEIAKTISEMSEIAQGHSYVFIDEIQFFNDRLFIAVQWLSRNGSTVICSGLNLDHNRMPFETTAHLLCVADKVTKLNSLCYECMKPAPYSKRMIENEDLFLVGGDDIYRPSCYEHFI